MNSNKKLRLSLSLDLDNTWSYLKIHGDEKWNEYPSHFPLFIPLILDFLKSLDLHITFFIVGKDAENKNNKSWLQQIIADGHEVGNHSYLHEPWMQKQSESIVLNELMMAHELIAEATGKEPIGFRGPGFCKSPQILNALAKMKYHYDSSLLATVIGPLARMYYFFQSKKFDADEKEKRDILFGSFSNALLPNTPFYWKTSSGNLLEIPVTTMPLFRTPIHLSYLIWLFQHSKALAWFYLKTTITLCKQFKVTPSLLLHPPDFMGFDDVPELAFFPGMNLARNDKLTFVKECILELKKHFEIVTLNAHAQSIETESEKLKVLIPSED